MDAGYSASPAARARNVRLLIFPELVIACLGVNIFLGLYTGLRISEMFRFRSLLKKTES